MVYGPIAAALVEFFPTRIRYSGLSLPYHIGNGWFGGLLPATSFAMVAQTGDIYFGLWYPIVVALMTFVIGMIFVPGDLQAGYLQAVASCIGVPNKSRPERASLRSSGSSRTFGIGTLDARELAEESRMTRFQRILLLTAVCGVIAVGIAYPDRRSAGLTPGVFFLPPCSAYSLWRAEVPAARARCAVPGSGSSC